jgi:imidazolonepropionase-like amidohydrolase
MAGSDTPHPFQIWGFGMVREIEALREAGLSNMAALRSATVVPRDYLRSLPGQGSALGWRAEFGTVEPGARADLLLLGADPSRDLAALKAIEAVVAGGRLYDSGRIAAMLRDAAEAGKKQPAPTPGAP